MLRGSHIKLLFFLLVLVILSGCSDFEKVMNEPAFQIEINTQSQEQNQPIPKQPKSENTPEIVEEQTMLKDINLKLGETAKTEKKEITVLSVIKTNDFEYASSNCDFGIAFGVGNCINPTTAKEEAGINKIWLIMEIMAKNVGTSDTTVWRNDFSLMDLEGYKYEPTTFLLHGGNDEEIDVIETLNKGQKIKGKILFEIPGNLTDLRIIYPLDSRGERLAIWQIQ